MPQFPNCATETRCLAVDKLFNILAISLLINFLGLMTTKSGLKAGCQCLVKSHKLMEEGGLLHIQHPAKHSAKPFFLKKDD